MSDVGLQRVRDNLATDLQKRRAEYEQARRALDGTQASLIELLLRVYQELGRYTPGEEPHKAVYLLATCHSWLSVVARPFAIIQDYERKQQQLEAYDIELGAYHG